MSKTSERLDALERGLEAIRQAVSEANRAEIRALITGNARYLLGAEVTVRGRSPYDIIGDRGTVTVTGPLRYLGTSSTDSLVVEVGFVKLRDAEFVS